MDRHDMGVMMGGAIDGMMDEMIDGALLLDWALAPARLTPARVAGLSDADWTALLERAAMHRLVPLLAHGARDLAPGTVPEAITAEIKARARRGALKQLGLLRDCARLHALLSAAGIPHLFLKGPYLAQVCYPAPGLRPMRDIDLLVPAEQAVAAWELLRAQHGAAALSVDGLGAETGYNPKHLPPLPAPGVQTGSETGSETEVEIHRALHDGGAPFEAHLARVWARQRAAEQAAEKAGKREYEREHERQHERGFFTLGGARLPCPVPEDMLLHLVVHGVIDHHLNLGPLYLTDLRYLIARAPLDWALIEEEAQALGLGKSLALSRALLDAFSDMPELKRARPLEPQIDPAVQNAARALLVQDLRHRSTARTGARMARMGPLARAGFVLRKAVPSRVALKAWRAAHGLDPALDRRPGALWRRYLAAGAGRALALAGLGGVAGWMGPGGRAERGGDTALKRQSAHEGDLIAWLER